MERKHLIISVLIITIISSLVVAGFTQKKSISKSEEGVTNQEHDTSDSRNNQEENKVELEDIKPTTKAQATPKPTIVSTPTSTPGSTTSTSNSSNSSNSSSSTSSTGQSDSNSVVTENDTSIWVSTTGDDTNTGTTSSPLATINAAISLVEDGGTIYVKDGTYNQKISLSSTNRFTSMTTIKAENALKVRLQYNDSGSENDEVIKVDGAKNVTITGFDITSSAVGCATALVDISGGNDLAAENIVISNNVIHDITIDSGCTNGSPGDLVKALSDGGGVTKLLVSSNIFYNQGPGEEQLDINGVYGTSETDYGAKLQGNIHFNNFNTEPTNQTQAYVTIKDSLGDTDGAGSDTEGARYIYVERNEYLNWQGRSDTQILQVGNDGKSYYEAQDVVIRNNLIQGNSTDTVHGAFQIANVNNVKFIYNTISGDLPQGTTGQFAFHYSLKGTPGIAPNNIVVKNNIFSDPTGTYGRRSNLSHRHITNAGGVSAAGLTHASNVYYNSSTGFASVTSSTGFPTPLSDSSGTIGDPVLTTTSVDLPVYDFDTAQFASGTVGGSYDSISDEHTRIRSAYANLGLGSVAIGAADDVDCPTTDIQGNARPATGCDAGAWEE